MSGDADTEAPSVSEIFSCTPATFPALAQRVLAHQRAHNPVYRRFAEVGTYLPIEAFKRAAVCTFPPDEAQRVFLSSGTGSGARSRHYVRDVDLYRESVERGFGRAVGRGPFRILAYLPRYAEDSSLVFMVRHLIGRFGAAGSTFFLDSPEPLREAARSRDHRLLLFGAAFGLVDLAEEAEVTLPPDAIVVETGGMKTHRRSMPRAEMHERLAEGFGIKPEQIWSEYGMCELMSQCYAPHGGPFKTPPWMSVSVMDPENPLEELPDGAPGALAVLDLANVHSASAILTQDRAVIREGGFEILGRLTGAELRGCNHLMERA